MNTNYSYVRFYAREARRRSWLRAARDAGLLALFVLTFYLWLAMALGGVS